MEKPSNKFPPAKCLKKKQWKSDILREDAGH